MHACFDMEEGLEAPWFIVSKLVLQLQILSKAMNWICILFSSRIANQHQLYKNSFSNQLID